MSPFADMEEIKKSIPLSELGDVLDFVTLVADILSTPRKDSPWWHIEATDPLTVSAPGLRGGASVTGGSRPWFRVFFRDVAELWVGERAWRDSNPRPTA